jgi:hypothetical protein
LAGAQVASLSVRHAYDAGGNRVKKGGAQASSYLIDGSWLPQVALEPRALRMAYVRLQLIRQTRVSGASQPVSLNGHLGTSLGAVDDGNVVEQADAMLRQLDQSIGEAGPPVHWRVLGSGCTAAVPQGALV